MISENFVCPYVSHVWVLRDVDMGKSVPDPYMPAFNYNNRNNSAINLLLICFKTSSHKWFSCIIMIIVGAVVFVRWRHCVDIRLFLVMCNPYRDNRCVCLVCVRVIFMWLVVMLSIFAIRLRQRTLKFWFWRRMPSVYTYGVGVFVCFVPKMKASPFKYRPIHNNFPTTNCWALESVTLIWSR